MQPWINRPSLGGGGESLYLLVNEGVRVHLILEWIHCTTAVIKAVWCWLKDRCIEKCNRIESLGKKKPYYIYGQLILNEGAKTIQWGK